MKITVKFKTEKIVQKTIYLNREIIRALRAVKNGKYNTAGMIIEDKLDYRQKGLKWIEFKEKLLKLVKLGLVSKFKPDRYTDYCITSLGQSILNKTENFYR